MYVKKGGNGGARPGAGRPKLEATVLREALFAEAEKRAPELVRTLFEMAVTDKNYPALKDIVDRVIGKAVERVDHTTKGEKLEGFRFELTPTVASKLKEADDEIEKQLRGEK